MTDRARADGSPDPAVDLAAAVAHHRAGQMDDAVRLYRRTLCRDPAHPDALHLLGQAAGQMDPDGDGPARAVRWIGRATVTAPALGPLLDSLAMACHRLALVRHGAEGTAAGLFRHVAILRPDLAEAHHNLALTLPDGRAAAYRRAAILQPDRVESWCNLACALADRRAADADAAARMAIVLDPGMAAAFAALGMAAKALHRPEDARTAHRRAEILAPDNGAHPHNLAIALQDLGRLEEAAAAYRRALARDPTDRVVRSNLLFLLHYLPDTPAQRLAEEHRRFGAAHACPPGGMPARPHANPRVPERRLRVGYVSPDLWDHPVAAFLAPLLKAHDRSRVEVFCYAERAASDAVTRRLRALSDQWRSTAGLDDATVAARIEADRIDVLVDLAGHTDGNRLAVFALRPAPVQVSWLGYPDTTGLSAIGHRLVDAITDPPGSADALASETLIRLPRGFLCYQPPDAAPEVAEPPCRTQGRITFGSFNNLFKLNAEVAALWAAILHGVPDARLLLKCRRLERPAVRADIHALFARHGVAERLDLRPATATAAEHLGAYGAVDVALDPFPYNGTTTTCEALWMGVPVVTLAGDRHAARVGASLLARLGLDELVAASPAAYVDTAAALAADRPRLAALRAGLRARLRASPLADAPGFAHQVEDAYRALWHAWCQSNPGQANSGKG